MAFDPLPALDRTSATFKEDLDTLFLTKLPLFSVQAEALRVEVAANASTATAAASTATTKAGEALASASTATTKAAEATTKAAEAAASAASAAALAGAFVGTSTTTWTPAIGSKVFATQAGEQYTPGVWVTVVSASDGTVNGYGQVTAYAGTSLTVNVQVIGTPAAKTDWNISIAGVRGPAGAGVASQAVGFTLSGGTASKTLTVDVDAAVSALATKTGVETLTNKTVTGLKETKAAVAASNIDLSTGNCFSKTASGIATWTVTNVPAAGTFASFILDLTNGGSAAQTWWSGVKWAGGTLPLLTAAGRDSLGFYTHDGGVTWTGLVLGRDIK
jgi:hypothetical protein